jgi:hypothetical protein
MARQVRFWRFCFGFEAFRLMLICSGRECEAYCGYRVMLCVLSGSRGGFAPQFLETASREETNHE